MADTSYDCVVIGSGPGGYVAAIRSAQLGMRTAIVEKDRIGGRCLNVACIPAKAVLRAADVMTDVQHGGDFGIQVEGVSVDFAGVAAHRDKVVKTLTGGVSGLMKKNKVDVIEGHAALAEDDGVTLRYGDGERRFDYVCIAAGRGPDFEGLGLEEAGVKTDERGLVQVDGAMRTSREGVFAIGDIVPGPALAHKASDEGIIAVEAAAGQETHPIDYRFVPAATFCHPQVASVGLTEKAARDEGRAVVAGQGPVRP